MVARLPYNKDNSVEDKVIGSIRIPGYRREDKTGASVTGHKYGSR